MPAKKKARAKKYEKKVKTDKTFAQLIKVSVTGKYVQARTKAKKSGENQ